MKNKNVVYSGKVGVKMRPRKMWRTVRRTLYASFRCDSGPLRGQTIRLDKFGDMLSLPVVVRGEAGRYRGSKWESSSSGSPAGAGSSGSSVPAKG